MEDDFEIELEPVESSAESEASLAAPPEQAPVEPLTITGHEDEGRYARFSLVPWWDQQLLQQAAILVVGAGALGNELLKQLALLGMGHIIVIDMDTIEDSNLTRSVLFRASDEGAFKAEVAARAVEEINPDCKVLPVVGNVLYDLGLGVFMEMDLVLGGLDNREARLGINQACWKVNTPWIDGAIEVLNGVARVFVPPDSACYECTMNELDLKLLAARKSCALLTREQMLEGKVPTTPTSAAVVAGVQVLEALKLLHSRPELPVLYGKGWVFNGLNHDSYVVSYTRKEDCLSHFTFEEIIPLEAGGNDLTFEALLERARADLGPEAVLDFDRELVLALQCEHCGTEVPLFKLLGKVSEAEARCPQCGQVRNPVLSHTFDGTQPYAKHTLAEVGIPPYDIVMAHVGLEYRAYLLAADRERALGKLAATLKPRLEQKRYPAHLKRNLSKI